MGTVIAISNKLIRIPEGDCDTKIVKFTDEKNVFGFDYAGNPGFEQRFRLGIYLRTPKYQTKEKLYRQTDGNFRRGNTFSDKSYELNTDQWDEDFHDAMEAAIRHRTFKVEDVEYSGQGNYDLEDNEYNNLSNAKATLFKQGYNSNNISC